jgi:hypothetical protein
MYYPYFRGKQFDLLTVREMAPLLSAAGFCPIIEPVRDVLGGLTKVLDAVVEADGRAIKIVNPHHGDLSGAGEPLSDMLKEKFLDMEGISAGILLKHETSVTEALKCYKQHASHPPVFILSASVVSHARRRRIADDLVPGENSCRRCAIHGQPDGCSTEQDCVSWPR